MGRAMALAGLVGIVAGFGAICFHLMCLVATHLSLGQLAGYEQGGPENETELHHLLDEPSGMHAATPGSQSTTDAAAGEQADDGSNPWLLALVLLPCAGGLISGIIVFRFAPEAEGHGTDAAIDAYHNGRGYIRPAVPIVKLIASAVTLGTGGSGGREGPIAQIGAGFGSYLATRLNLSDNERRVFMAAGLGAGIGAIFHAPLAGAIFAVEVLYRDPDFESEALIPAFISTTVAYSVFASLSALLFARDAFVPLFVGPSDVRFTDPTLLAPLALLALVMVVASLVYVKVFYGLTALFHKLPGPRAIRPAIGGLLTGVLAVALYLMMAPAGAEAQHDALSVLSFGYGFLQKILLGQWPVTFGAAITLLLVVGVGKLLTTSLTIGSGGSGGVFGPSMVIGGSLGAVVGLTFHHLAPTWVGQQDVVMFTILGMAAFFAACASTPVSTLIMVTELTGSYALLLPAMWVCALAYLTSRGWTLYHKQVANRLESPAHRGDFIVDILQGLTVDQALTDVHRKFKTVPPEMSLADLSQLITSTLQLCFPVVDHEGRYRGLFSLNDLREFLYESDLGPLAVAEDLLTDGVEPITTTMDLSAALSRFAHESFAELAVVHPDEPDKVVAMLRREDLISLYDRRLLEMRAK